MNDSNYSIKPLDGSPLISANCWNTVIDSVKQRIKKVDETRCLEWGGGNSTISLLRTGFEGGKRFELHSIDHDTRFFPFLAESVISEFLSRGHSDTNLSWKTLAGPKVPLSEVSSLLSRHRLLKASTIDWQILTGNKRIQFAEGITPFFGVFRIKCIRQIVKFFLIQMEYLLWLFKGVIRNYLSSSLKVGYYSLEESTFHLYGEEIKNGVFSNYFNRKSPAGCLEIRQGNALMRLWHLPELNSFFWKKGLLFDGSIAQLPDFLEVPVEGRFDLVFVDGRARVSCIKRTFYDKLLKNGGFLFVHDAYRAEMMEGFTLFTPTPTFIQGSNIMLNGNIRCEDSFGYPLVRTGESAKKLDFKIAQELFMYPNQHESD